MASSVSGPPRLSIPTTSPQNDERGKGKLTGAEVIGEGSYLIFLEFCTLGAGKWGFNIYTLFHTILFTKLIKRAHCLSLPIFAALDCIKFLFSDL